MAKEVILCLVDVSSSMTDVLPALTSSLFTLVHSHLVYKPENEVGIIFFGTTNTDNALYSETESKQKVGRYSHVTEIRPIDKPDVSYLSPLENVQCENGRAHYPDALAVAVDSLCRRLDEMGGDPSKYRSRLLMFSDFSAKAEEQSAKWDLITVQEDIDNYGIKTEIFAIDDVDKEVTMEAPELLSTLGLNKAASTSLKRVTSKIELYSLFPVKPVSSQTLYRGPMDIGGVMQISVKVLKKTSRETMPIMKPYSSREKSTDATHAVVRDVEYKSHEDPSLPVPPEHHIKGYIYGIQYIPIPYDIEHQLEYIPIKGIRLIGFVTREQIPRCHYLKDTFIVLPEQDASSQCALSALVQQCAIQNKMAIVQCALRKGSHVFLGALSPFIDHEKHPDAFLMNLVPFADDVRDFYFSSFSSKKSLIPSDEQMDIMSQIVEKDSRMDLDPKKPLFTDNTSNPLLKRLHRFLGKRGNVDIEEYEFLNLVFPSGDPDIDSKVDETLRTSVRLFKKQKRQEGSEEV